MPKTITQRELRNESGEIMRALDRGESFVVTRNGVVVGQLTPAPAKRFVPASELAAVFASSPPVDAKRFRRDVDRVLDQRLEPRA
ncbi:MAG TPA: hypothetical protein VNB06_04785 [Thermoanaerobaculia bacterium]|nr:hypothetical protein [Thermoanaerobaculia bacterium]